MVGVHNCTIPEDHRYAFLPGLDYSLSALCFTTGTLSLLSNLYVMYVLVRQWRNRTIFLFFNMAITDIVSGICCFHLGANVAKNGYNIVPSFPCYLMAYLFNVISLMTPQLMTFIAVMRFFGVFYPLIYKSKQLETSLRTLVAFSWTYTCLLTLMQMISHVEVHSLTRFCDIILSGRRVKHRIMYYSSLIFNVGGLLIVIILTIAIATQLSHQAAKKKPALLQHLKKRSFLQRLSQMTLRKRSPSQKSTMSNNTRTSQRKFRTASRISILFALNFTLCYFLDALYYALPSIHFQNLSEAVNWMTGCNATRSLYLRFWYYYSVGLSSLLNAVIHLAVNEIVHDHLKIMKAYFKDSFPFCSTLSRVIKYRSPQYQENSSESSSDDPSTLLKAAQEDRRMSTVGKELLPMPV